MQTGPTNGCATVVAFAVFTLTAPRGSDGHPLGTVSLASLNAVAFLGNIHKIDLAFKLCGVFATARWISYDARQNPPNSAQAMKNHLRLSEQDDLLRLWLIVGKVSEREWAVFWV